MKTPSNSSRPRPTDSIGIVGAGPAGLTVAEELGCRGYTDITILEARGSAGGKVHSLPATGDHAISEAGAVWYVPGPVYTKYLRKFGVDPLGPTPRIAPAMRVFDRVSGERYDALLPPPGASRLCWFADLARLYRALRPYGHAGDIGFRAAEYRRLCGSFQDWLDSHRLGTVGERLTPIATAAQFGHLEHETAAAYVLKGLGFLERLPLRQTLTLAYPQIPVGNQTLWTRMAAAHNVLTGQRVSRITRDERVHVTTSANAGEPGFAFDHLVWTAPAQDFMNTADAGAAEADVLGRVRTTWRSVATFRTRGLGTPLFFAVRDGRCRHVPLGYPSIIGSVAGSRNLHTFYSFIGPQTADDEIAAGASDLAGLLGGEIVEAFAPPVKFPWFPHFTAQDLSEGIYERFESLQGKNHVYFAGEILAGVSVPFATEYSADLVNRFF